MKYRDARAFRQALEQRLKDAADGDPARLVRSRKRLGFEGMLARLTATAPGRWLLKGAFALDLRLGERARATKDVDIEWVAAEDELLDALIEAARHDAGDFFEFAVERTGTPPDRLGGSHRFRVAVSLAARPFESFLLDVGFGSEPVAGVAHLATSELLTFAGIEPVRVAAIPLELHVAEKVHAYTRTYEGSRASTRAKDLVDLVLIAELSPLDAIALHRAIEDTFGSRGTHRAPANLPHPPGAWRLPLRQLAEVVGVPADLAAAHDEAAALLDPILDRGVERGSWDPLARRWNPQ